MNTVEIKKLIKTFGKITALDNLSLNIEKGKITGLIGADGAGKTTLLRTIIGLLIPDKGDISTLGFNPVTQKDELTQHIGYMPQKFGLYEDLTVIENLMLYADLKGIETGVNGDNKVNGNEPLTRIRNSLTLKRLLPLPHGARGEVPPVNAIEKMLEFTKLAPFQDRLAGALSGGMKQKLGLACTLLGNPEFLLLDEPSVGVDPISRRDLMKMVREMITPETTVLWSTAYLDEAHSFDTAVVIDKGKVIYEGKPHALAATPQEFEEKVIELMGGYREETSKIAENYEYKTTPHPNPVLDLLHAHGDSTKSLRLSSLVPFAIRTYFVPSVRKSALPHRGQSDRAREDIFTVEADNLEKKYGSFYAVKNNTFKIKKGEIFGLLGPNGAGKSTSFKMMCGLAKPTNGTARIMGIDITKDPEKARSNLGYMAQKFSLYGSLTVQENLEFFASAYGIKFKNRNSKVQEIIEVFDLKDYANQKSEELPLGLKQRLSMACALIHNPPVLFLDEPTSGVDVITRRDFWNHITSLAKKGVTILVTTHFMDEAEYCDRISLFYKGETIALGTPEELKRKAMELNPSPQPSPARRSIRRGEGELLNMEETFIRLIKESEAK